HLSNVILSRESISRSRPIFLTSCPFSAFSFVYILNEVNNMKFLFFAVIAFVVFPGLVKAQIRSTENTIKLAEGQTSEAAMISDMAWLAGSWIGTGLDGISEEMWSKPANGVMM